MPGWRRACSIRPCCAWASGIHRERAPATSQARAGLSNLITRHYDKQILDRVWFLALLVCPDGCDEASDELCHGGVGHNEHGGHLRHLEHYRDQIVCVSQAYVLADTFRLKVDNSLNFQCAGLNDAFTGPQGSGL